MLAAWRERDKDKAEAAPVSNQQGLQQKDDGNSHASARLPTWDEGEGEGGGASGVRHTCGGAPNVTAAGVLPFFFCSLVSLQRGSAAPVSNKFARQRKDAEPQAIGAVQADFG